MKTFTFEVWNTEDSKIINKVTIIVDNVEESKKSIFENCMQVYLEEYYDTEVTKGESE